jgi:hypothetical protein
LILWSSSPDICTISFDQSRSSLDLCASKHPAHSSNNIPSSTTTHSLVVHAHSPTYASSAFPAIFLFFSSWQLPVCVLPHGCPQHCMHSQRQDHTYTRFTKYTHNNQDDVFDDVFRKCQAAACTKAQMNSGVRSEQQRQLSTPAIRTRRTLPYFDVAG